MRPSFPLRFSAAIFSAALALVFATASFAADEPKADAKKDAAKDAAKPELKIIKPEDAKDHEGEVVTVEFKVVAGREIDSGVCFLNSSTKRDDPKGFTAFITNKGLKKFKEESKLKNPADLYKGKTVRVSGAIKKFTKDGKSTIEIEVADPSQITIVEEQKDEKKEDKKS